MTTIAEKTESGAKAEHTPTPCPCGNGPAILLGSHAGWKCVYCNVCGLSGPDKPSESEAISDWNLIASSQKLAAFKAYVHQRLDAAGVPADPESPHKAEGCRIGGRLEIVLRHYAAMPAALAAMKQGRSALAVLAQSDPTYEPAWRALTDAIKLAEGPMGPAPEGTCEQEEPERWDGQS